MPDYRLERWIAVILALLFFLPFIANAQESPLALVCSGNNAWLQPAGPATPDSAWMLDDARLSAGTVARASCAELPVRTPAKVAFNGTIATLDYRCGEADDEGLMQCTLELDGQPLARRIVFETEPLSVLIGFAGDLDRDGRLDLLLEVGRNRFDYRPALFLSSPARPGELVTKVAELGGMRN